MTASQKRELPGLRVITELVGSRLQRSGSISLFADDRSRVEPAVSHPDTYRVERRDQRKLITVYSNRREYQELPILSLLSDQETKTFQKSGTHWRKQYDLSQRPPDGTFRIRITYERIPEQKQFFGCTAYRWKITRQGERDHLHGTDLTETITDAWYFDSAQLRSKYAGFSDNLVHHGYVSLTTNNQRPIVEQIGKSPSGLCARSQSRTIHRCMRATGQTREEEQYQSSQISALTEELFPQSLFEVPEGFSRMPVYPSRFTMALQDLKREVECLQFRLGQRYPGLFGN